MHEVLCGSEVTWLSNRNPMLPTWDVWFESCVHLPNKRWRWGMQFLLQPHSCSSVAIRRSQPISAKSLSFREKHIYVPLVHFDLQGCIFQALFCFLFPFTLRKINDACNYIDLPLAKSLSLVASDYYSPFNYVLSCWQLRRAPTLSGKGRLCSNPNFHQTPSVSSVSLRGFRQRWKECVSVR